MSSIAFFTVLLLVVLPESALAVSVQITSPPTETLTNDSTPTITVTHSGADKIEIYDNYVLILDNNNPPGTWTFDSPVLGDGTHKIRAEAIEHVKVCALGDCVPTSLVKDTSNHIISITIDTTPPPAPSITSPSEGSLTNINTPTFIGTSEPDSEVQLFESGGTTPIATATADNSGSWSAATLSGLSDGRHSISAKTIDRAGNASPLSAAVTIEIDTQPPSALSITYPANGSFTNDNTPTISGSYEEGSKIKLLDGNTEILEIPISGTGWSITLWALEDGLHTITAKAVDSAGNVGAPSAPISFTVDTAEPEMTITSPEDGAVLAVDSFVVTGTAADDISGIDKVEIKVDSGSYTSATGTTSWSFTTASLPNGSHSISVRVIDKAGNSATATIAVKVEVATQPPPSATQPPPSATQPPPSATQPPPSATQPPPSSVDTEKPRLIVPSGHLEVDASSSLGAQVIFTDKVSAIDNLDGTFTPECIPASGSIFPIGDTKVTCTATDRAGNKETKSFTVTVQPPSSVPSESQPPKVDIEKPEMTPRSRVDTEKPELTVPSAPLKADATGTSGAQVNYASKVSASDNIDGAITAECTPISGSIFPIGGTKVTCTATDSAGNKVRKTFTVVVQPGSPPTSSEPPIDNTTIFVMVGFAALAAVAGTVALKTRNGEKEIKNIP